VTKQVQDKTEGRDQKKKLRFALMELFRGDCNQRKNYGCQKKEVEVWPNASPDNSEKSKKCVI